MSVNIGGIDRVLRIIVGSALIAAALGYLGSNYQTPWAWIGVVPLATALIGWCPAYTILGIKTCKA